MKSICTITLNPVFAAAYGTAACMSRGTQPPRAADVNAVLENVRVYKR